MAIEKMRLVRINARSESFDGVLSDICISGMFQPENAQSFYSSSMGLVPFQEENTAGQKMSELESFAKAVEAQTTGASMGSSDDEIDEYDGTVDPSSLKLDDM